jgi:hypothetical protein
LANICINNPGSAWTATVYDSATGSGTVIAVISFSSAFSLAYNIAYKTGLTIVTSGTTPGDLTVSWL